MPFPAITEYWEEYYRRVVNYGFEHRLVSGKTDYARFIILSRSRSGSNFLVDLLNSHRNVNCYSELFSRSGQTYWGIPGYRARKYKSNRVRQLKQDDPVGFLSRYIYRGYPRGVSAVGFKLFYNQAQKGSSRNLWKYLRETEDLKIIHLKRKNLLKVLASKKIAEASKAWVKRSMHDNAAQGTIELSHEECLRQFEKTRRWQQEFDEFFAPHAKRDVIYEELVADTDKVMNSVQTFLGLQVQHLAARTQKQSSKSLADVIVNYKQLKDSFEGTEWAEMFE